MRFIQTLLLQLGLTEVVVVVVYAFLGYWRAGVLASVWIFGLPVMTLTSWNNPIFVQLHIVCVAVICLEVVLALSIAGKLDPVWGRASLALLNVLSSVLFLGFE